MTSPNPNWPLTVTSVALSTDPFDSAATPSFVDISTRVVEFDSFAGRQYELDTAQAGEATFVVNDRDEVFNPTNPSSPYAGNVKPYRLIVDQAQWPPVPLGGAVNLLNTTSGFDPSFESYTAGASVSWVLTAGGVSPTVSTSNPQQGSKSLQYSVVAAGGEQGVGLSIPCIPGQQYTSSLYLRQTAANTTQVFINGGASGTSTTTTGAYARLAVTWTATMPVHQLWVVSFTTGTSGTVNVDAIQHEPSASASAFTTTGPVIYTNFAGFVERWPSTWQHMGIYGQAKVTCVDALAVLAGQFLSTEYRNAVLAKAPAYYWPLSEPSGATSFGEISGNGGPALQREDSVYGPAPTFAPGTQINLAGDPSGTGIATQNTTTSTFNMPVTVVQTGLSATTPKVSLGTASTTFGIAMAFWAAHTTITSADSGLTYLQVYDATWGSLLMGRCRLSSGVQYLDFFIPGMIVTLTDSWADNAQHFYVVTGSVTAGSSSGQVYIDGVLQGTGTGTISVVPSGTALVQACAWISSSDPGSVTPGFTGGVYAGLAFWNRSLSSSDVTSMWNGGKGYPGETPGARIARYLSYNWIYPTALDAGASTMDVSNLTDNTSLLDACLSVTASENGRLCVQAGATSSTQGGTGGTITFHSRTTQYRNTTAQWVFGENAAGGEYPYEADIAFDFDPQLVYNDVQVTRSGGVTALGGTQSQITASRKRYGKRSLTLTINVNSNLETEDHADWIFAGHADAHQRIATLTVRPSANPSLWPLLGVRQGDRATVKRRTSAGYTMSADFFVERVEHARKPGEWTLSFQMSPAAAALQPGIFDDAAFGLFDTTMIYGY